MVDFRKVLDRAQARLLQLKDGNSVGAIMKGDPMVSGTQIFATRQEAISAAQDAEMPQKDRQIISEADTVVEEMTRDIVEEIDRGFLA